ncbi:Nucleolar and coiled-body phosphoprotein [Lachnellula hyalina]|uniref:Nucleolar and coiled-body phosphoprotein n=1 Tax=Lachnellula hyalina TaxID=1316788 RepID=A0A8H8R6F0_9HELO|nr:Nucleolar and coiled-body phosphoprotein [Lachnellula hyalina]TVY29448.1 Nucleolar and coiled-body phosphoprotein [Lachnellula hyalina]
MSGNPNMEKIGKRKNAPAKKQADWLFPSSNPSSDKPASTSVPKSQNQDRSKNKEEKQLAKDLLKQRAGGASSKPAPPSQLVGLIGAFLSENEFASTTRAFRTESGSRGLAAEDVQNIPSLNTIYNEWLQLKVLDTPADSKAAVGENGKVTKKRKDKQAKVEKNKAKVQESSGASDVEMTDAPPTKVSVKRSPSLSSSASSSSSDSDADDEKESPTTKTPSPKPKPKGLKRKAVSSSSESSTSGPDSSSEEEAPKVKKVKTKANSPSSSESSTSSSESDSSSDEAKVVKSSSSKSESSSSDTGSSSDEEGSDTKKVAQTSSSSESDSSESESDSSSNSIAQNIPLPASDSDSSDSSSESDSDSTSSKKGALNSESSATLSDGAKKSTTSSSGSSSDSSSSNDSDEEPKSKKVAKSVVTVTERKLSPPLPPDPIIKKPFRKTNVPFSRISSDIKVDERLASNAYVPYDYAQKAHEDLIVTKGKGFTKEKNKKKRGSYRGGYIDVEGKKGIKFED